MKTIAFCVVAAGTALGGSVQAGGPTAVAPEPLPAAEAAPVAVLDWSGAYGGLSYGRTDADLLAILSAPPTYLFQYEDGNAVGGFLGYNIQRGTVVYGAELGYSDVSGAVLLGDGLGGDDTIDSLIDLRARVGYATGRALFYGAFGYSRAETTVNGTDSVSLSGASFGVGIDYMVSQRMFVGLDYTRRNLSGTDDNPLNTFDIETDLNTLGLRVGLSF